MTVTRAMTLILALATAIAASVAALVAVLLGVWMVAALYTVPTEYFFDVPMVVNQGYPPLAIDPGAGGASYGTAIVWGNELWQSRLASAFSRGIHALTIVLGAAAIAAIALSVAFRWPVDTVVRISLVVVGSCCLALGVLVPVLDAAAVDAAVAELGLATSGRGDVAAWVVPRTAAPEWAYVGAGGMQLVAAASLTVARRVDRDHDRAGRGRGRR
ncbi:MAG: hypothetical protein Q7U41_03160 [Microbacterium sp.]|nr:hypothetical protein [Microbacterium sp.]